jgi:hypothetical protein
MPGWQLYFNTVELRYHVQLGRSNIATPAGLKFS